MNMRVLVVDDDAQTLSLFVELLERQGCDAIGAATALRAIEAIDRQLPDLVLSDWDLGTVLSGVDVADHLRAGCPDCALVMMTGRDTAQLVEETKAHNVRAYLKKPFPLRDLSKLIDELRADSASRAE